MVEVLTEQKTTEFLAALDDFVADIADQTKALRFYTCLGNVKLYVLLEYGYPKVKINGDKKELLVYTSEPTELLKVDGLSTVALGQLYLIHLLLVAQLVLKYKLKALFYHHLSSL